MITKPHWQQTAEIFHDRAEEYDSWYEESLLFDIELAALQSIRAIQPYPRLEIGTGPGRFASGLGIKMGIDPAFAPLLKAQARGIKGIRAIGEHLPLETGSMGSLYLILTLCFIARPEAVIQECHRALKTDGMLIFGFIPADSIWGKLLCEKGRKNHPYYRYARFLTVLEVTETLTKNGFTVLESCSTLYQTPDMLKKLEKPRPGLDEQAGFCVLIAGK